MTPSSVALAPAALSFVNRSLKGMTSLFQTSFKTQVHVHTDSEIPDSLDFSPFPSVIFHLYFWIPFFFMGLTLLE